MKGSGAGPMVAGSIRGSLRKVVPLADTFEDSPGVLDHGMRGTSIFRNSAYVYPAMGMMAAVSPISWRVMNPGVRAWWRQFYAEITDWTPCKAGTTLLLRGAS